MAKKKTTVIEMEIPDWANEETIPTITDAVYDLVTSLPKGYGIKTKSGEIWNGFHAVSYTHLTLPTILLV